MTRAAVAPATGSVLRLLLAPRAQLLLKILASAALVSWLAYATDRQTLTDALLGVDVARALLAVLVLLALIGVQAWRWTFVAHALDISLPLGPAWVMTQIGAFFSQVLPTSIGGDAMRVWRLHRRDVRAGIALASVFLDRMAALVATLVTVTLGLPWLLAWMDNDGLRAGILTVVFGGASGVALVLFGDRIALVSRLARRTLLARLLDLPALARQVFLRPRAAVPAFALSMLMQGGVALSVWLLAWATHVDLRWTEALLLVPVVILLSMLPITIAGWGVREGAMVVLLGTVGVSSEEALAISVLFGVAVAIAALPGGLLWLVTGGSSATHAPPRALDPV